MLPLNSLPRRSLMKHFSARLFLVIALVLSFVITPVGVMADDNASDPTYEVVLLVDVSGSMGESDPQQLAYEALKTFAVMAPSHADMYISVVAYNNSITTVMERVNVSDPVELDNYLDTLSKKMPWRSGGTNTGAAMREARGIMERSTADAKAVVLFTDGATQITNGSMTDEESIAMAKEDAAYFGKKDIPVFCAGLDESGANIDESFLKELAAVSAGQYLRCYTASEINSLFIEIFARFMGVENWDDELEIKPDVDTKYTVDIYGQAIMEANINLFSDAAISSFSVTDPSGTQVAFYEAASGNLVVDESVCEIFKSDSNYVFNVKIKKPIDGNWTVTMRSKTAGRVIVSKVQLYNIDIRSTLGKTVSSDTATTVDLHLFNNDTNNRITTERIYRQSECTVQVVTESGRPVSQGKATLNSNGNGYRYNLRVTEEGRYRLVCKINNANKQFNLEKVIPFEVAEDKLSFTDSHVQMDLSTAECYIGEQYTVSASLLDPATGEELSRLPDQYRDCTFKLLAYQAGKLMDTVSFDTSDYKNGAFSADLIAKQEGKYTFEMEAYTADNQMIGSVSGSSAKTLKVNPCTVSIELPATPDFYNGVDATVSFKDATGVISKLPEGYANAQLQIELYRGSELQSTTTLDLSDFRNGQGAYRFDAPMKGDYSFRCTLINQSQFVSFDQIPFKVADEILYTPQISVPAGTIPYGTDVTITVQIAGLDGAVISQLPDRYSDMKVEIVIKLGGEAIKTYTLSASDFSNAKKTVVYTPTAAGDYTISATLSRGDMTSSSNTVTPTVEEEPIYKPVVTLPGGELTCATGANITVSFKNYAGTVVSVLPEEYNDMKLTIKLMQDGAVVLTKTFSASDVKNGKLVYTFLPEKSGAYTVAVTLTQGADSATAESVTLEFPNSEIQISDEVSIPSIKETNTSGQASGSFDFGGLFVDSDGDALTYTVEADDPENVEVIVDGTMVQINVKGFTKSQVTITAQDPYGAVATYSVTVQVKSLIPLIIVLCVLGVLLIAGGIVALIIIQKRKVISVAFNVKIEHVESGEYVVYNVMNLSRKKNVKPTMLLSDILSRSNLSDVVNGELTDGDEDASFMKEAQKLELTGLISKKGFVIKSPTRKTVYQGRQATATLGSFMFSFGRPGSFDDAFDRF